MIDETIELSPIIFSHGCAADSFIYSRHLLELASHGYAVFAIQHNDQSCNYTEKKDGSPVYFDRSKRENDEVYRRAQIEIRESEILALIDEMSQFMFA